MFERQLRGYRTIGYVPEKLLQGIDGLAITSSFFLGWRSLSGSLHLRLGRRRDKPMKTLGRMVKGGVGD